MKDSDMLHRTKFTEEIIEKANLAIEHAKEEFAASLTFIFFLQNVDLSIPRTFLVKFRSHLMPGLQSHMIHIWLSLLTTSTPPPISQQTGV